MCQTKQVTAATKRHNRRYRASPVSAPKRCWETKKGSERFAPSPFTNSVSHHSRGDTEELPDQDSNLDKQNQNLLCYRYTIGQFKAGGSVSNGFVPSQALVMYRILAIDRAIAQGDVHNLVTCAMRWVEPFSPTFAALR